MRRRTTGATVEKKPSEHIPFTEGMYKRSEVNSCVCFGTRAWAAIILVRL